LGGGVRANGHHRECTGHDDGNGNEFAEHVILPSIIGVNLITKLLITNN
jgi:hypothetical protein